MLPPDFNLIPALLDWLWRSWTSLGISGHGGTTRADRVIDPEALVLASTLWARYDARLFDEMLDWLCLNGSLVNLQRLSNLHRTGLGDADVLSAIAAIVQKSSQHTKWKVLAGKSGSTQDLAPLFLSLDGNSGSWGDAEPGFAAHGFHRGKLELRQMSQIPDPGLAPNLWLKLRSLFGTSTRAEIMLQLLTTGPATAGEIARRSGFSARSILVALREMAQSGHILEPPRQVRERPRRGQAPAVRTRGSSLPYSLRTEEWSFLRTWSEPVGFPALRPPGPLLLLCQKVLQCLDEEKPGAPSVTRSLRLREATADALADVHRQGFSSDYGLPAQLAGGNFASTLATRLPAAIASL
jgi:hypothetical protein